jgi:hypothetical protein
LNLVRDVDINSWDTRKGCGISAVGRNAMAVLRMIVRMTT